MKAKDEDCRQALIEAAAERAAKQGKGNGSRERQFARQFLSRVPADELASRDAEVLAGMATHVLALGSQRLSGEVNLKIFNPDPAVEGWECPHSVIEIINDDMPFLVDSVVLALSNLGIVAHLIIHPVMRVERDQGGHLMRLVDADADTDAGMAESIMHLQVDRQTYPEALARIEKRLLAVLEDVRRTVRDWRAMRTRVMDIAGELAADNSLMDESAITEAREFFEWLADDHFTFLGFREYVIEQDNGQRILRAVPDSGLGLMRESYRPAPERALETLTGGGFSKEDVGEPIIITKTNNRSTVHRGGYMDYISVLKFDADGKVCGEKRLIGLFTSGAYIRRCQDTPLVRRKVGEVTERSGLRPGSHAGKALLHILETLPRDELFQATSDELLELALGILDLQERSQSRVFIRRERFGRFYSCLVFIPRDRFNTENRERIQGILKRALKGDRIDFSIQVGESKLARVHVVVRLKNGQRADFDIDEIETRIRQAIRSWEDGLTEILVREQGEEHGLALARRFARAFPVSYIDDVGPGVAYFDVMNLSKLKDFNDLRMSLYKPRKKELGILRFKLFKYGEPIPLSDVLPMLENLGMRIVSERPYQLYLDDGNRVWIQDFDMRPPDAVPDNLDEIRSQFQGAFERTWRGMSENDGFNRLIMLAKLDWRQVTVLRACCKYLLQTGVPFSQSYMEQTLAAWPLMARLLVEYFAARFDPARDSETRSQRVAARKQLHADCRELSEGLDDVVLGEFIDELVQARELAESREAVCKPVRKAYLRALEQVSSADQDRILRAFADLVRAALRTNFYQRDERGEFKDYVSLKFDSSQVPDLPKPVPYREIWVYSPRVEGVHLRGGPVARGGLRWSDRREDFRTEVFGLLRAQNVKNTMIVPVGAKGGFFVKHPPVEPDRSALMAEGVACYRTFINGLLDITDNLDGESIVPPDGVVRQDDDDPYLVVAADKGTAAFSDIANAISSEQGFWLDDAFASGGSNGYDHKKMGITAKGAWESVKRHFRELGIDTQSQPFSVVGIGDMSGDVFGNGLLLSEFICLKAAFNHQHIFLDPDPDPAASFAERKRLFALERSSWDDYDKSTLSAGGGIFSRQAKTIPISPQVQAWLGIEAEQLTPHALIRELLKAPVDLLWNGGIGTYVKSARETHADVGDLANNPVRVDGRELKCRVIGEGGNLGLTQLGRIEFALEGGRLNTDFIDNSAGVDCSDHEVNIKILLNLAVERGRLDQSERNRLLAEMTPEVESLVLRSNYLQTQALSMLERLTKDRLGAEAHLIAMFERQGVLDRDLEHLPDEEELRERIARGRGLTRPELALLFSYSKITLNQELLISEVPEDPYLSRELVDYFPSRLREDHADLMGEHRLRREIIATRVTNSIVNRMGPQFVTRLKEDTGANSATVAKAYTVAREIFHARDYWSEIESLDNQVEASAQLEALMEMWNLLRHMTRRLITLPGGYAIDISSRVERFVPGLDEYRGCLMEVIGDSLRGQLGERRDELVGLGFPATLATICASLRYMHSALDIVDEAINESRSVAQVAEVYFRLLDRLSLRWLRAQIESLPVEQPWHAHARGNLRDELFSHHRLLVRQILAECADEQDPIESWFRRHDSEASRVSLMLEQMRASTSSDYAALQVAVHGLGQLLHAAS